MNKNHVTTAILATLGLGVFGQGCLDRPLEPLDARLTSTITVDLGEDRIDKIDILLAIDDSGSMGDKQVIMSEAIPRLIESLVNPDCVANDPQAGLAPITPPDATAECPTAMHRRFEPVNDIHVGVISTSVPVQESDGSFACESDATLLGREQVETYDNLGFLAWDPLGEKIPAGATDSAAFRADLADMVTGVGQRGCGWEQPLESWYRFLIDPDVDSEEIVRQRKSFLRSDSLLAIVMLTDENDCSIDPDAAFDLAGIEGRYNVGCFEQRDHLYPVERYTHGLTRPIIETKNGQEVPNPLFADGKRSPNNVILTGIVGVPWQQLARDPDDLAAGLMNATELAENDVWSRVLGNPEAGTLPGDAHMVESPEPREGLPRATDTWDPVHGHEFTVGGHSAGELQYACTFALPEPFHIDCADEVDSCDCKEPGDKAVCRQPDGSFGTTQRRAKAYPGLRQLQVLQSLGNQAIPASICASQLENDANPDYGYQPAIGALVDKLAAALADPCLARNLPVDPSGQVSCVVVEGRASDDGTCSCEGEGRFPVRAEHAPAVSEARSEAGVAEAGLDCFCEIEQLRDAALDACRNGLGTNVEADGQSVDGWCYTDDRIGNAGIVQHCEATQKQTIRLMGGARPGAGARTFITCAQEK